MVQAAQSASACSAVVKTLPVVCRGHRDVPWSAESTDGACAAGAEDSAQLSGCPVSFSVAEGAQQPLEGHPGAAALGHLPVDTWPCCLLPPSLPASSSPRMWTEQQRSVGGNSPEGGGPEVDVTDSPWTWASAGTEAAAATSLLVTPDHGIADSVFLTGLRRRRSLLSREQSTPGSARLVC